MECEQHARQMFLLERSWRDICHQELQQPFPGMEKVQASWLGIQVSLWNVDRRKCDCLPGKF